MEEQESQYIPNDFDPNKDRKLSADIVGLEKAKNQKEQITKNNDNAHSDDEYIIIHRDCVNPIVLQKEQIVNQKKSDLAKVATGAFIGGCIGGLPGGIVGGIVIGGLLFYVHKISLNNQYVQLSEGSKNELQNKRLNGQNHQQFVNKKQLIIKLDNLNNLKKQSKEIQIKNYIKKAQTEYTKLKCQAQIAKDGRNKVIFIGNTSVGKSSLINKLYKLNLKTGKLQTTFGYEKVHTINNTIDIYDSQGYNQDNHDQQVEKWQNLNNYRIIFILYQDTLKASKTMVECLCKPKDRVYKVYFICTKCDLWDDSNNKTIDQEIEQQRNYLKSIGILDVYELKFFKTSASNDKFYGCENENSKIIKLIEKLNA